MDSSEPSKNKNEDTSSSSQPPPESSNPNNYQDNLSPTNHPVNTYDDLDDFLLGDYFDSESFAFTPPHLVFTPETETLLLESGIAGGDLHLEDPCNTQWVHQEKPAHVDELGEIQAVELPSSSQEWTESNLFADEVLGTEPSHHDSSAQASQEHLDLIDCLQFGEAASNADANNTPPIPANIPEEPVSSAPSSVAEDKRAASVPPRSCTNFTVKPFGLRLNSLIKATKRVHSATEDVGLSSEGNLGSKRMKHRIVISPGNKGKSIVRVRTMNERHETEASVAAADCVTSENPCLIEPFNSSSSCLTSVRGNKKTSPSYADNSEKLNQPGPRENKRQKTTDSDTDDFNGCTCKKSACMILYCDCFAAERNCAESCTCQGCLNRQEHQDKVNDIKEKIKSRNPFAFAPKIVQNATDIPSNNKDDDNLKTTSSTRHEKGCFEASQEHHDLACEEAALNAHGNGSTDSPIPAHISEHSVPLAPSFVAEDIRASYFLRRSSRIFTWTHFGLQVNTFMNATPPVHSAANDRKSSMHISTFAPTVHSIAAADLFTPENPCLKEPSNPSSCPASVHDNKETSAIDAENSEKLSQPGSSKKKVPNTTDTDGFKVCTCKKSACVKLYCECFAAEHYCTASCTCQGCLNRPEHQDKVVDIKGKIKSRNPLAFAPKIVQNATDIPSHNMETAILETASSARHKRGCKCIRSKCGKKYCECFEVEVGCTSHCLCKGCENPCGKKEEPGLVALEDLLSKERDSSRVENVSDSSHAELGDNDVQTLSPPTPLPFSGMG